MARLSHEMQRAVAFARKNENKIQRFPGGFWGNTGYDSFGTTTISALVKRGVAEYSKWQEHNSGNGRFPIEITVK